MGLERKLMLTAAAAVMLQGCDLKTNTACPAGTTEAVAVKNIISFAQTEALPPGETSYNFGYQVADCSVEELDAAVRSVRRSHIKNKDKVIEIINLEEDLHRTPPYSPAG